MSNVAQGDISWLATIDDDTSATSPPADREPPSRWRPDWVTGPWTATDPPARTTGRADGGPEGVWICDLVPERSAGEPLVGHDARVAAVTTALVGGRPVVVAGTAGWGATVRVFDLDCGRQVCRPLVGRTAWVGAARATVAGRPVAVTGDSAGVRVWDPATGLPIGEPLIGSVRAVATAELDGRPVAIVGPETARNGDADNAVRVIDLATGAEFGAPLTGHSCAVTDVATAVVHGRPVAVTGSRQAARVWDLVTREPIGAPLAADVCAVATGLLAGRPIVVAGGSTGATAATAPIAETAPTAPTAPTEERGTVQVWDLTTHTPIGPRLLFPLPVGALTVAPGGRVVVAFGRELAVLRHG
ncbi:WD40 repeat domain-containing protein [Embleya sp. NPDC059237]|uniref:WD40 repeat domain-containing protein n=1 Tax=Embleya sp. NPDC059237 TaxID=3346784 RepID=UPI0036A4AF7F